jgi:hypothetical protein
VKPFHGYFDESGTHDGSDIVALVGYLVACTPKTPPI